jgi:hypothetical protein
LARLINISYENHTIDFPARNGREPGFSRSQRNRISKKIKRAERSIKKKWRRREEENAVKARVFNLTKCVRDVRNAAAHAGAAQAAAENPL